VAAVALVSVGGVAQSLPSRLDKSPSENVYWLSMRRGGESVGAKIATRIARRLGAQNDQQGDDRDEALSAVIIQSPAAKAVDTVNGHPGGVGGEEAQRPTSQDPIVDALAVSTIAWDLGRWLLGRHVRSCVPSGAADGP
jgi:hypothetical protein